MFVISESKKKKSCFYTVKGKRGRNLYNKNNQIIT